MDHVDAQLLQIRQFAAQPGEVTGKAVEVERHTYPLLAQKPVVVLFPRGIQ